VLGGHGPTLRVSQEVDVYRCGDELALRDRAEPRLPCADIAVRAIVGPGAKQHGVGFIGGDFGPEGAVGGMLGTTVLNPLATGGEIVPWPSFERATRTSTRMPPLDHRTVKTRRGNADCHVRTDHRLGGEADHP
jgi:hypothetical protein